MSNEDIPEGHGWELNDTCYIKKTYCDRGFCLLDPGVGALLVVV